MGDQCLPLTYAVPLLITGRLGDKFGPKKVYQLGLLGVHARQSVVRARIRSASSSPRAACRVWAPRSSPRRRWPDHPDLPAREARSGDGRMGTVAGVATLVGPLLGGVLTDSLGWEWIFFVNIPIGIIGLVLAATPCPMSRPTTTGSTWSESGFRRWVCSRSSSASRRVRRTTGAWDLVDDRRGRAGSGPVLLPFGSRGSAPSPVPLELFRDRNFTLSNLGIASMGFAISGSCCPRCSSLQLVGGMSPTQSAVMMVPQAILTGILAPIVGRILDRVDPRLIICTGLGLAAISMGWLGLAVRPETPVWQVLIPMSLMGVASAGIWAPLAATATRNLPWHQAGAGAGVWQHHPHDRIGARRGDGRCADADPAGRRTARGHRHRCGTGHRRSTPEFLRGASRPRWASRSTCRRSRWCWVWW